MTYRTTSKARKLWSENANAKQARDRLDNNIDYPDEIDHYMKITVERRATGEVAVFECFEGDRIDNYRVTCNGIYQGVQSITTLTKNIRKALPRFRRIND